MRILAIVLAAMLLIVPTNAEPSLCVSSTGRSVPEHRQLLR